MNALIFWVAVFVVYLPSGVAASESDALVAYSEGLGQLSSGQWDNAATAFHHAQTASPTDTRFLLAHAVALGLGEKYAEAVKELAHMPRIGNRRNREPEFWTYVFETMGGFATPEHRVGGPRYSDSKDQLIENEAVSMRITSHSKR